MQYISKGLKLHCLQLVQQMRSTQNLKALLSEYLKAKQDSWYTDTLKFLGKKTERGEGRKNDRKDKEKGRNRKSHKRGMEKQEIK